MIALLKSIEAACAWFGRIAGWTIPVLIVSVCIGVLMVQLRTNVLADWGVALPLLGERMTLNGLNDLQWHLFAVMVMLGGIYALHDNGHVCVDVLANALPERMRRLITLFGDLFLLLPFAAVMAWFAWRYMVSAYTSGEGSSYGGLTDRWIIKAIMPVGFGLLGLFGLARALRLAIELATARDSTPAAGEPER